jgi:formylmethanofuran dehydrogenase subunit E
LHRGISGGIFKQVQEKNMTDFESYLKKAGDYHGHICAGIVFGTRISLAAMKALGLDPDTKNKNLIVYTEIDRCMTDAVQVISGCHLGHRSLKYVDYGKFAATYVNTDTGKAVRGTIRENFKSNNDVDELIKTVAQLPEEAVVTLQGVKVAIPEVDLPGMPRHTAICSVCGEKIMDGREVNRDGAIYCRACSGGKYYTER